MIINESIKIQREYEGYKPVNLVICPNTLTYQWVKEVEKFFGDHDIKTAVYESYTSQDIQQKIANNDLDIIVVSYERARNDVHILQ